MHTLAREVNSKTQGIFYMEYTVSKRSKESNKEGNDWASVLKPQWSNGREPLVEKDSCISVFVYFSCSFSLYNRTFAFQFFLLDALQSMERGNTTERCKLTRNSMLTLWILICMFQVIDSYTLKFILRISSNQIIKFILIKKFPINNSIPN